jgi:hypothetical protein
MTPPNDPTDLELPAIGHNGGPPLAASFSMTIEDACRATGFNETQMRGFVRAGRVRSFRLGKRRYIEAASLRRLVEELVIKAEADARAACPRPRRGKRGRWMSLAEGPAAKA